MYLVTSSDIVACGFVGRTVRAALGWQAETCPTHAAGRLEMAKLYSRSELRSDGQARRPVLLDDCPFHLSGRGEGQLEERRGNQRGGHRQEDDGAIDAVTDHAQVEPDLCHHHPDLDRKSTRLNSSH